jgi:hypothetical protein
MINDDCLEISLTKWWVNAYVQENTLTFHTVYILWNLIHSKQTIEIEIQFKQLSVLFWWPNNLL